MTAREPVRGPGDPGSALSPASGAAQPERSVRPVTEGTIQTGESDGVQPVRPARATADGPVDGPDVDVSDITAATASADS